MNTSGMQNQSNANMSSFKTNQNLDRLSKISERLANIHLNIENDKYSKYEEVEVRIATLEEKAIETNEVNFKTFTQIKDQITSIIQNIEEDRQKFEEKVDSLYKANDNEDIKSKLERKLFITEVSKAVALIERDNSEKLLKQLQNIMKQERKLFFEKLESLGYDMGYMGPKKSKIR